MKVTFIGGGNMATALIGGMLRQGFDRGDVQVVEIMADARAGLAQTHGVRVVSDAAELASLGEIVVLAVKPQQMGDAARAIAERIGNVIVLTIAAGIRLVDLSRWLGGYRTLVRCMPNTPALIGAGVTGVYAEPGVNDAGRRSIERILSAGGKVVWVKDESLLDPVTAVSGSGPAYVFYFIEALEEAGIELGLEPAVARTLALETFRGAAELAVRAAEPPSTLRARVTSKGGTTERAISTFDHDKLKEAIHRGVRAANARAGELALQFGKD